MTGEDKVKIYRLLKAASDNFYSFSSPDFPSQIPLFTDDVKKVQPGKEDGQINLQNTDSDNIKSDSSIERIARKIAECNRCQLSASRKNVVPGMGVENPLVLVIGEGPGEEEDKQGKPFVGPAGQLLDKMLAAIGLYRDKNCYIANIVKCRPPMNRIPFPEEASACRSFLDAQISALKPKAILCAGSTAVKNLLETSDGVLKLHGKILDYKGIPLVTTWHPSALLRDPSNKRGAWEDLKVFRSQLLKIAPDYEK